MLVPEATIDETAAIAERIRAAVEDHVFILEDRTKIRITVSIGAAVHPDTIRSKMPRSCSSKRTASCTAPRKAGVTAYAPHPKSMT